MKSENRKRTRFDGLRAACAAAIALAFAFVSASRAATPDLDIANLLNTPRPDELTAAPSAPLLAWVADERGARNLYSARAPEFTPRKLTA